jgi:hypothetical protein
MSFRVRHFLSKQSRWFVRRNSDQEAFFQFYARAVLPHL